MTVEIGQFLSQYRVLEEIGRGGMGVVYRARDARLDRDVAIKVLPPGTFRDDESRRRLRKEAAALARINHPNIQTVHDFNTHDGIDFLVTEFVPGVTLSDVVSRGPLPEARILDLARQLADGLAAAHAENVVHRDLKPANVKVTPEGHLKILDFGLARFFREPRADASTATLSETRAFAGTLPYMSPEQIDGDPVDARSDLWAAGVVLYEMALGVRPFAGATPASIAVAIKTGAPPPPSRARRDLPAAFDVIVAKCLEKNPELRYQSARELGVDLRRLSAPAPAVVRRRRRIHPAWLLTTIPAIVGSLYVTDRLGWNRPEPADSAHPRLLPVVMWSGIEGDARISPDGRWMLFASQRGGRRALWRTELAGGEPLPVAESEGIVSFVWSPDGTRICVHEKQGDDFGFRILPAQGGAALSGWFPEQEAANGTLVRWVGGHVYFESSRFGLVRWPVEGGPVEKLASPNADGSLRSGFDVCPDTEHIVFGLRTGNASRIWESRLDGSGSRTLTGAPADGETDYFPRYLGGVCRDVAFVSNATGQSDVWIVDRSGAHPAARRLTTSPEDESGLDGSADGRILTFTAAREHANLWRRDPIDDTLAPVTTDQAHDIWPDGREDVVVFQRTRAEAAGHLNVFNASIYRVTPGDDGVPERIVTEGAMADLSPDGSRIAFVVQSPSRPAWELKVQDLATGEVRTASPRFAVPGLILSPLTRMQQNSAWTPEGHLLFACILPGGGLQGIRSLDPWDRDREPETLVTALSGESLEGLTVSPDGRYAAFARTADGNSRVCLLDRKTGLVSDCYDRAGGETPVPVGWRDATTLILLAPTVRPDWTYDVAVIAATPDSGARTVARASSVFPADTRLDTAGRRLALVGVDDRGNHNLFEIDLDSGDVRQITRFREPGTSFGGLHYLPDGSLVFARMDRSTSIWSLRFDASPSHPIP